MSSAANKIFWSEIFSSILTLQFLPYKYDSSHEIFQKSNTSSFFKKSISWSIVPKAFNKSIKIKPVYFSDTTPLLVLSVNNVKQDFVEKDLRNHDW